MRRWVSVHRTSVGASGTRRTLVGIFYRAWDRPDQADGSKLIVVLWVDCSIIRYEGRTGVWLPKVGRGKYQTGGWVKQPCELQRLRLSCQS